MTLRTKDIFIGLLKGVRTAICTGLVIVILAVPLFISPKASHINPTLFGPGDGALDRPFHLMGVYQALRDNYVAGLMMMTEQMVSIMMEQMLITATFLDAEQQMQAQGVFQELAAEAHKDFHPSFQMCEFGTTVRSLGLADRVAQDTSHELDQMLEKREHLHANLAASGGIALDVTHRIKMFKDTYCDLQENSRAIELMCENRGGTQARRTKDIDFARVVDNQYTLDLNYSDSQETNEEKDIIALGQNLYAGTVIDFIPEQLMNEAGGQALFLETRSIHAIRSVARYSFTNLVGMKAEGDQDDIQKVRPHLYGIIKELGVPDAEIKQFLGENPSYFAQMEVLTRKIYHSPDFFTNLYDKPANVKRIGVALQAIELMQDRDRFESALRREMLISLILELKLRKYQEEMYSVLYSTVNKRFGIPEL